MKPKQYVPTETLMDALKAHENYVDFLRENESVLGLDDFKIAIRLRMFETGKELGDIFKAAHLKTSYAYQILNGQRQPTRDKILQFAFGMSLNIEKTNQLLSCATKQPLYAKRKRDAAIIFAILHSQSIETLNEHLILQGFEPLYTD